MEDAADIYGLDLITEHSLVRVLPRDPSKRNLEEISHINGNIHAPVNKGDRIGYVEFLKDGISIGKVDLIAARDIEYEPAPVTLATLTQNPETIVDNLYFKIGICCAVVIILFIIIRLILKVLSRRSRSRKSY